MPSAIALSLNPLANIATEAQEEPSELWQGILANLTQCQKAPIHGQFGRKLGGTLEQNGRKLKEL